MDTFTRRADRLLDRLVIFLEIVLLKLWIQKSSASCWIVSIIRTKESVECVTCLRFQMRYQQFPSQHAHGAQHYMATMQGDRIRHVE